MAARIRTATVQHTDFNEESDIPFKKIKRLGQGGFGVVDKVMRDSQYYARKTFTLSKFKKSKMQDEISHEIAIANAIDHIHAVRIVETYACDLEYAIILEPVADGNLEEYLHDMNDGTRDDHFLEMIPKWFGCLAGGMAYLHARNIHHRDIKPQNILYLGGHILFTDFGISKEFKEKTLTGRTQAQGTRDYWAPELDEARRPGRKADIFSLGVVFLEMLTVYYGAGQLQKLWSRRPYSRKLDEVHGWINDLDRKPLDAEWYPTMVFLCRNMIQKEKENRPFADALVACWDYLPFSATPPTSCGCIASHQSVRQMNEAVQKASENGHQLALQLMRRRGDSVDRKHEFNTALLNACIVGDLKEVKLLLERGVDVNAEGGYYGNALQTASRSGYIEVVKLLLEKGADVKAEGGFWGDALQTASGSGHIEVVKLLLEKGADVKAEGGYYGNALQAASVSGRIEVVKLLLEKGADVKAEGGQYGNALQAASVSGRIEVVKLLLEKGADVKAEGGQYGNALQAASKSGHAEIVELLKQHKISEDIN
jgi:serine/threonine protein kinase/autonomous glycyl radical cofactor GrcA